MAKSSVKAIFSTILAAMTLTGCFRTVLPEEDHPVSTRQTQPVEQETTGEVTMETTETSTDITEVPLEGIDLLLSRMTLREKVGQLFIVRPDALDPDQSTAQILDSSAEGVTVLTDEIRQMLEQYPVGGIALFGKNITSPEQITALNEAFQESSTIALFLCVDEEGGTVSRLANHTGFDLPKYKNAATVGQTGDASQAYAMGSTIGSYLAEYGFNLDFAPVADVNTNPDNPIIGNRAFSSQPQTAAQMAGAMADGLNTQGVLAVFKHFPGHGDTAEDSHLSLAVSYKTAAEMLECEWLPFLEADNGDLIMVGHIAVPEITGDDTPATLSYTLVTEILKGDLGFQGLVITDALEMGGITQQYSSGEAAVAALLAGCDILLMPEDLAEAFEAVVSAVEDGTLSNQWLDSTVRRILECKQQSGILQIS